MAEKYGRFYYYNYKTTVKKVLWEKEEGMINKKNW